MDLKGNSDFIATFIATFLAVIGGLARMLDSYVRHGTHTSLWVLLANLFVSGFCGAMAAQTALIVQPSWVYVAAGIGGYLGTESINLIREYFDKKKKG